MTRSELIEALEKAEGPSRELDRWCAWHNSEETREAVIASVEPNKIPRFTASIDAALTLVPQGGAIESMSIWPGLPGGSYVTLIGTHERKGERWHSSEDGRWRASHKHPAIALCIAALKAGGES